MEVLRAFHEPAVGLGEDELLRLRAVDEDAVLTGGVVVARGVVLAIDTGIEDGVHVEVGNGVGNGRTYVAKLPVDGPDVEPTGYLLVFAGGIGIVLVEVVIELVAACDVTVAVNLVVVLRRDGQCQQPTAQSQ